MKVSYALLWFGLVLFVMVQVIVCSPVGVPGALLAEGAENAAKVAPKLVDASTQTTLPLLTRMGNGIKAGGSWVVDKLKSGYNYIATKVKQAGTAVSNGFKKVFSKKTPTPAPASAAPEAAQSAAAVGKVEAPFGEAAQAVQNAPKSSASSVTGATIEDAATTGPKSTASSVVNGVESSVKTQASAQQVAAETSQQIANVPKPSFFNRIFNPTKPSAPPSTGAQVPPPAAPFN